MKFLAIVKWDANGRLDKYQVFETEVEAQSHVLRVAGRFPGAFVAEHPGGGYEDWLIDPLTSTLSVVPRPIVPPIPHPLSVEELYEMLVSKGVVSTPDRPDGVVQARK